METASDRCRNQIAADCAGLGVVTGDTLMVHSSFKALGPVPGGIETLVAGLLRSLGPTGTLLLPALSYLQEPPQVHDARRTPSNVGAVLDERRDGLDVAALRGLEQVDGLGLRGVGRFGLGQRLLGLHHGGRRLTSAGLSREHLVELVALTGRSGDRGAGEQGVEDLAEADVGVGRDQVGRYCPQGAGTGRSGVEKFQERRDFDSAPGGAQ